MLAYKYLSPKEGKQDITGIEIARLKTGIGNVPVIATCETKPGRITVFWWSITTAKWESWSREVGDLNMTGMTMREVTYSNWSNRVAIVAAKGNVFVIYNRKFELREGGIAEGLLMDRLEWDEAAKRLILRTIDPIRIPVSSLISDYRRPGYYLWAGFDLQSEKLLIVFQAIKILRAIHPHDYFSQDLPIRNYEFLRRLIEEMGNKPGLYEGLAKLDSAQHMLQAQIAETVELTLLSLKLANLAIDFEAKENWRSLTIDQGGFHFDAYHEEGYLYCLYRTLPYSLEIVDPVSLSAGATSPQVIPIPGDPNNDSIYATLSFKRIEIQGTIAENLIDQESSILGIPGGEHPQIQKINPLIFTYDRIQEGELRIFPPTTSMLGGQIPMRIKPRIKHIQKLVVKRTQTGYFRNKLFSFELQPRNLQPANQDRSVFNETTVRYALLNGFTPIYLIDFIPGEMKKPDEALFLFHSQIYESVEVTRFKLPPATSVTDAERTHYQNLDINHSLILSPYTLHPPADEENPQFEPFNVNGNLADNTLGGALVVDRSMDNLGFLSYSDLGDGGCRVIYDESLPQPDPIPVNPQSKENEMDPTTVTGMGSSDDLPVEIIREDWFPLKLPNYFVGADAAALLTAVIISVFIPEEEREEFLSELMQDPVNNGSIGAGIQPILDSLIGFYWTEFGTQEVRGDTIILTKDKAVTLETALRQFPDLIPPDMSLFDTLWQPYDQIVGRVGQGSTYTAKIGHSKLTLSKYEIEHFLDDHMRRDQVKIKVLDFHDTEARFLSNDKGQGAIDYRFKIRYFCDNIHTEGPFSEILTIKSIETDLLYSRHFTPAILMSEQRCTSSLTVGSLSGFPNVLDPPKELLKDRASALCTKPIGDTRMDIPENGVKIETKITFFNLMFDLMISLLIGAGLAAVATAIYILITNAAIAAASPFGWWLSLILIAAAVFICTVVAPPLIRREIERRIIENLSDPEVKKQIDDMGVMTYAGEGLAEGIARIVCQDPTVNLPIDTDGVIGRNRFRDQFWQTIFVQKNKCKVWVRK